MPWNLMVPDVLCEAEALQEQAKDDGQDFIARTLQGHETAKRDREVPEMLRNSPEMFKVEIGTRESGYADGPPRRVLVTIRDCLV